jgi:hypothetical protein
LVLTGVTFAGLVRGPGRCEPHRRHVCGREGVAGGRLLHAPEVRRPYHLFVFLGTIIFVGIFFGFTLFDHRQP